MRIILKIILKKLKFKTLFNSFLKVRPRAYLSPKYTYAFEAAV